MSSATNSGEQDRHDRSSKRAAIAVYGASGHTGRFVVAELQRRNLPVIAVGRDPKKLDELVGVTRRTATLEDPAALDRALAGARVVINCAGPFLDTAQPVIDAALRLGASYLDVTPEQQSARDTLDNYDTAARNAGVKIVPAASFFGGFAELLARLAMQDWSKCDMVRTAIALDSWQPTEGTRATGRRNRVPRVILSGGVLVPAEASALPIHWRFPAPFNEQPVSGVLLSEIVTIARDDRVANARSFMNLAPQADLADPRTLAPIAIDTLGRSSQLFVVDVVVENDGVQRRALVAGQDIYAVTAPIIVEAAERIFRGEVDASKNGTSTLGELFDPRDFLAAVAAHYPGLETQYTLGETENA